MRWLVVVVAIVMLTASASYAGSRLFLLQRGARGSGGGAIGEAAPIVLPPVEEQSGCRLPATLPCTLGG